MNLFIHNLIYFLYKYQKKCSMILLLAGLSTGFEEQGGEFIFRQYAITQALQDLCNDKGHRKTV